MAQPTEIDKALAEMIRVSEASRHVLTESHDQLRRALDVPARIKESITGAPGKWLGGSLVAGLAASLLFRRKKAPEKVKELKRQRGFLLGLLSVAFTMGKPLAKAYATRMLGDYAASRIANGSQGRIPRREAPPY